MQLAKLFGAAAVRPLEQHHFPGNNLYPVALHAFNGPDCVFGRSARHSVGDKINAMTRLLQINSGLHYADVCFHTANDDLRAAGRFDTLTTEAVSLAASGNRRVIGAYALMQMLLPFLAFALAAAVPAWMFRHRRGLRVTH